MVIFLHIALKQMCTCVFQLSVSSPQTAWSPSLTGGAFSVTQHTKTETLPTINRQFTPMCEMRRCVAPLLLWLFLLLATNTQCAEELCEWYSRTIVDAWELLEDGRLQSTKDGVLFLEGTFWLREDNTTYWACPCLLGNCIKLCEEGTF